MTFDEWWETVGTNSDLFTRRGLHEHSQQAFEAGQRLGQRETAKRCAQMLRKSRGFTVAGEQFAQMIEVEFKL